MKNIKSSKAGANENRKECVVMFREMRRFKQLLSKEETVGILKARTAGVLGVNGDDGYPYTVPVSYVYDQENEKLYFHGAYEGHKIDSIKRDDKVTFSVIDKDDVIQETFTTHFSSVSIFGRARILEDDAEKRHAMEIIVQRYSPDFVKEGQDVMEKSWSRLCVVEIKIEHMTGKKAIELVTSGK